MKRFFALVLALGLVFSFALAIEGTIKLKTLGRSPLTGPVTDAATAKQVVKNHVEEIRKLENDKLFFDLAEQLDQADFRNEIIPIGATMRWMLFRDKTGVVRNIKNVEWVGQEQFQAFGFEILHENMIYHFFVSKICGNICLYQIKEQPLKQLAPPPSQTQPVQPPPPVQPQPPIEPRLTQPQAATQSVIVQKPNKKYHPDFKLKFGPWIPWEPMTLTPLVSLFCQDSNQNVNVQHDFQEYLPEYEQFHFEEDSEFAQIHLSSKNFPYDTGDNVILKLQRSVIIGWSGIQFNIGAEARLWKGLWLGVDYYQSRKLKINVHEYREEMLFKKVKYAGSCYSNPVACPPPVYIYCLRLNRHAIDHQTNYTAMFREANLILRYYLTSGRFSLAPAIGIAGQQFSQKMNDTSVITDSYPFKDEIISQSEPVVTKTKTTRYDLTWTAGLSTEIRLLKFVSIAAEGSYRKLPKQSVNHSSALILSPFFSLLNWNLEVKPWRATASLKVIF